jgi:DNA polymerase III delta prime subunit
MNHKNAPKMLDDVILPPRIKNARYTMWTHQYPEHLLFYGTEGIGKTTTAIVLSPENTYLLHASVDWRVDRCTSGRRQAHE